MNESQSCLTDDVLHKLERDELSRQQVDDIETHLTTCTKCQSALDSTDSNPYPNWQAEICPVLREAFDVDPHVTRADEEANHETFLRLLSPSEDPQMLGRVGGYEVVGVIGQGGMGVVFKAFDTSLNRFVAIKMLLPHLTANGAARKRFLRETQAAAAVVDDHVLPIFGVDEWQGTPYLVMQYSRGTTLQKRIHHQGPLSLKETLRIGLQTARGLAAAHAQGLVHRDVKPANILLDGSVERAVLMDFGLARAVDDASVTRTGIISGTPMFMSPEQVRADSVDARSDLFSLGSTLYAMCAGWPPFRSKSRNESAYGVMHRITHEEPTPICEVNSDVPAWLGLLIERLMSKNPEGRFASAGEVADLLEGCLAHVQQPTQEKLPDAVVPIAKASGESDLKKWLVIAGCAACLVFAGMLWVQEMNKGKLVIECSADDVPIRVMQGDTVVEKLSVTKAGATIKVAAGKYVVEIDGDIDGFVVENDSVVLSRGGLESVRIRLDEAEKHGSDSEPVSRLIDRDDENVLEIDFDTDTPIQVATKIFRRNRKQLDSLQVQYCRLTASGKDLNDTTSIGFSNSKIFYWRPANHRGWIYDGQKMQNAKRETDNGALILSDCDTDFSRQFCGSRTPLQVAGYLGLSERTVPYLDEIINSDPSASASWVLREKGEDYSNVRPGKPQSDRMLRVEFEYPIPILPETDSGKPFSAFSPLKTTLVLDPLRDYCVAWHRTESTLGYHKSSQVWKVNSFRTFHLESNGEKHLTYFPQTMFLDHENSLPRQTGDERTVIGVEVIDLKIGEPFDARKFYSTPTADISVESATGLRKPIFQLKTVEEAEARIRELIAQHKTIANAEIEYTVWSSDGNGNTLPNRIHVWLDGENGRRDYDGATEIQTAAYSYYGDGNENRFGKGEQKFTRNTIPTLERMVGLYLPDAVVSTYDLEHHLLPENRKNVTVELGQMEGQPVTIVKFDRELPHADQGWTRYFLSPTQGNCPTAITHSHSFEEGEKPTYSNSTQVSWRNYGEIWFPQTIRNRLHSEVDARDERDEIKIERARFNVSFLANVFEPTMDGYEDQGTASDVPTIQHLTSIEEIESNLRKLFKQREQIKNADVEFTLTGTGSYDYLRRYHVWKDGAKLRADAKGPSSDGQLNQRSIITPEYVLYKDFESGHSEFAVRSGGPVKGNASVPELAKFGFVNWNVESLQSHSLEDAFFGQNRKDISISTTVRDGEPLTIVQYNRVFKNGREGWGEYWLSPAQGNHPVYICNGLKVRGTEQTEVVMSQQIEWRQYDSIWFPERIERKYQKKDQRPNTNLIVIHDARFNKTPFPDVFDPTKLDDEKSTEVGEQETATDWEESPGVVFERFVSMDDQQNWDAAIRCMTDDCRDEMVGELLFGVQLIQTFSIAVDDEDDATAPRFKAKRFMIDLEKRFPGVTSSTDRYSEKEKLEREKIAKRMASVVPTERRQARIALVRMSVGNNSGKLFAALSGFMRRLTDDESKEFPNGSRLVNVDMQGDKAFAVVVDGKTEERTPVTFCKVNGQWKLDKLISDSVFDQMTEMNRKVEDINARMFESAEAETKEYFLELSRIPLEEQSLEVAFQNHLDRKTVSLYPDVNETAPLIVLCEHSAKGKENSRLKLAIFSDGHVITTNQGRVFADQLSKAEIDALFDLMRQQKLNDYMEDPADLKISVSELIQPKLLPLALKVTIPKSTNYQESIEIAATGKLNLVIAPVENKNIAYSSIKSNKERVFKIVRDRLLQISNTAIAGGDEAVYAYRFIANEHLKKEHPTAKPFDENDSLAAFLVNDEKGAWQKRIEFIRHKRGEVSVDAIVSINHQPDAQPVIQKIFLRGGQ